MFYSYYLCTSILTHFCFHDNYIHFINYKNRVISPGAQGTPGSSGHPGAPGAAGNISDSNCSSTSILNNVMLDRCCVSSRLQQYCDLQRTFRTAIINRQLNQQAIGRHLETSNSSWISVDNSTSVMSGMQKELDVFNDATPVYKVSSFCFVLLYVFPYSDVRYECYILNTNVFDTSDLICTGCRYHMLFKKQKGMLSQMFYLKKNR